MLLLLFFLKPKMIVKVASWHHMLDSGISLYAPKSTRLPSPRYLPAPLVIALWGRGAQCASKPRRGPTDHSNEHPLLAPGHLSTLYGGTASSIQDSSVGVPQT